MTQWIVIDCESNSMRSRDGAEIEDVSGDTLLVFSVQSLGKVYVCSTPDERRTMERNMLPMRARPQGE